MSHDDDCVHDDDIELKLHPFTVQRTGRKYPKIGFLMECLSESATKDLVDLLVRRGYFHNVVPGFKEDKKTADARLYSETDSSCQVVSTHDGVVMTKDRLQKRLLKELTAAGGRLSVEESASILAVDPVHIEYVSKSIMRVGENLITEPYLDRMAQTTNLMLIKNDGRVLVSELATSVWEMPSDLVLGALEKRIASGMIKAKIFTLSGAKVLVTPAFEKIEKYRIRGAFRAITMPTQVCALASIMIMYTVLVKNPHIIHTYF
jgi:hypothetical protein